MTDRSSCPTIAVLDYGIGNLRSAQKALIQCGADAVLTDDGDVIGSADGVVLPGVGAFGACMGALRASGLDSWVKTAIAARTPFLGICVGMQMLFEESEESPGVSGLGVFPGRIRWLPDSVKRPQMQWNQLSVPEPPAIDGDSSTSAGRSDLTAALLDGLNGQWAYFVHSLSAEPTDCTVATVEYGARVTAAVAHDRVFATQFHPEKSASAGLGLLSRFVEFCAASPDDDSTVALSDG